jgi:hypothetical protein
VQVVKTNGTAYYYSTAEARVQEFEDTKKLDELNVKLITESSPL